MFVRSVLVAAGTMVILAVLGATRAAAECAAPSGAGEASPLSCALVGNEPQGHGVFRFPQAIGFSPGGSQVFVGDQFSSLVQKFSIQPQASGPDVATWQFDIGGHADRRQTGRLGVVGGVATDRSGHVFVLDSENDRVQVYASADGTWLGAFGESGTGEGQFDLGENTGAGGIAVWQKPADPSAPANPVLVFVADQRNDRVQRFTVGADGLPAPFSGTASTDGGRVVPRPDADWVVGSFGDCNATGDCASPEHNFHLNYPQGISVNPADWSGISDRRRIYIADDDNHRVLIWDDTTSTGPRYAGQIGSYGTGQGRFRFPYDVGVDWHTPNYLYVADNNNHRVQEFDADSYVFARMWGSFGAGAGDFEYPRALAALDENPRGGVYVSDTANNRIQGFDVGGHATVVPFGVAGRGPGYFTRPWAAAVDADGNVYVADTFAHRVEKLAADGTYLGQWGYISANSGFAAPGSGDGQFNYPRGVAYDQARGRIWVADTTNDRVQAFGLSGQWLESHSGFSNPYGIAADASGDIYVADTSNRRVRRWSGGSWTTVGTDPGFVSPRGVASAGGGVVYVADLGGGVWRFSDGSWGKVDGAPTNPGGVWVDRARNLLYVSDQDADRVMRLDLATSGSPWQTWGGNGTQLGALIQPAGLTTDATGAVLIADAYNNRIQRWELPQASAPPANQSPTAAFTAQCSGLSCTFTSTSTDSDGTITSHAWDFGDGVTATGPSPSHTYLTGGTYPVTLTVTDDQGATAATTQAIAMTAPSTSQIELTASGYKVKGIKRTDLTWTGATSTNVDVYRSGARIATTANDGAYTDNLGTKGSGSYTYKVCEAGTSTCSREVTVSF